MKKTLILGLIVANSASASVMDTLPPAEVRLESPSSRQQYSPQIQSGRRLTFSAGAYTSAETMHGTRIGVGYRMGYLGLDFRANLGSGNYGAISETPNLNEPTSDANGDFVGAADPTSEINVVRDVKDPWKMKLYEIGISTEGRAFPSIPLLTQRARAGIGFGTFSDIRTGRSFTPGTFSAEAGLIYALGLRSPYSVELTAAYHFGKLQLQSTNTNFTESSQLGRLPTVFTIIGLNVSYSLRFL